MPDKYPNFESLVASETESAFSVFLRRAGTSVAIVAPHGGGIEPGTSEIALALAGRDLSYYVFEGVKARGNGDLHITSTNFDDPRCLSLLDTANLVITVHGENSGDEVAYIGGRDSAAVALLHRSLLSRGFKTLQHTNPGLQGLHADNLCNKGRSGSGVQMELSRGLRKAFFSSLTRAGRRQPTPRLVQFAEVVRQAILHKGPW
jgi:phage replication-related protein YjqB (UPF0714/DUF867 family)